MVISMQVQNKGDLTLLKLADFGLACIFKKGSAA